MSHLCRSASDFLDAALEVGAHAVDLSVKQSLLPHLVLVEAAKFQFGTAVASFFAVVAHRSDLSKQWRYALEEQTCCILQTSVSSRTEPQH